MKKCLLILVLLATSVTTMAQLDTVATDPFPDEDLLNIIENLPDPRITDTSLNNVVLNLRNEKIGIELYNEIKGLKDPAGYSPQIAKFITILKGLSESEKKLLNLKAALSLQAQYLSGIFDFKDGDPAQKKIGYSWGSKHFEEKLNPPGKGDNCIYTIHGLDCSGFIYQLFARNGINMPYQQCNAETERKPEFLTKYLKKDYFGKIAFEVKDLGKLETKSMQSGDILYFKNTKGEVVHIAIALLNERGDLFIYQSIGNPNRSKTDFSWCEKNISDKFGVISKKLVDSALGKREYACVRIVAK